MENTKNKKETSVNLLDIAIYLLAHWYWFVLCIGIAAGYTYYRYAKTPFTYRSEASILIKSPNASQATYSLDRYSNMINRVNLSLEMLQLKSEHLVASAVKALDLDVNYTIHDQLRDIELYNQAPVRLYFSREERPMEQF